MVDRLDEAAQHKVDDAWSHMLLPPDRLERTLLLDCIISAELHQFGVDRLHFVSEKEVADGRIVMEVQFDRAAPEFDEFSVTYVDRDGREARRERFAHEEVKQRIEFLYMREDVCEDMDPQEKQQVERRNAERERRLEEIREALGPLKVDGP
jgi:hypothetical protein